MFPPLLALTECCPPWQLEHWSQGHLGQACNLRRFPVESGKSALAVASASGSPFMAQWSETCWGQWCKTRSTVTPKDCWMRSGRERATASQPTERAYGGDGRA